jgi:hypothetical protein
MSDYICSEQRKSKKQLRKKRKYRVYKKGGHERAFLGEKALENH